MDTVTVPQTDEADSKLPPWPSEWSKPGGLKPTATTIASGIFGVTAAALGIKQSAFGEFSDPTVILLAGGLFGCAISAGTFLLLLRVRQRGVNAIHIAQGDRETVTIIPNSRAVWRTVVATLSAGILFFGIVAAVSWFFLLFAGETSARMIFQALLSTAFVSGMCWFLVRTKRQQSITQGSLQLSPTGVFYKSLGPAEHTPWEAMLHTFPSPGKTPDIVLGIDPAKIETNSTKDGEIVRISGSFLAIDPALAYHALDFYLNHPEFRAELGTERSVERIRQAKFTG